MIYNEEKRGNGEIDIDILDNKYCAISLFTENQGYTQSFAQWDLSQENCMSFCNNYKSGYAFMEDGKIKIRGNVHFYLIFFK